MIRGFLAIEVVILLLLLQPNHWLTTFESKLNSNKECSREKSRIVRNVLLKKIYPILDKFNVNLPLDCPFHPNREIIWWPEINTFENNLIDNKRKKSFFLTDYFNYLNEIKNWLCPFCGLKFLSAERLIIHWDDMHRKDLEIPEDSICLADYCDIIRCDVLTQNTERNYFNKYETKLTTNSNCDKNEMKQLLNKCETMINQCLVDALDLEGTLDELQNLKTQLFDSICSYLTCDLYYKNNLSKKKNISIKFYISTFAILSVLFSICYYLVWNLFEGKNVFFFVDKNSCEIKLNQKIKNKLDSEDLIKTIPNFKSNHVYKFKQPQIIDYSFLSNSTEQMQNEDLKNLNLNDQSEMNYFLEDHKKRKNNLGRSLSNQNNLNKLDAKFNSKYNKMYYKSFSQHENLYGIHSKRTNKENKKFFNQFRSFDNKLEENIDCNLIKDYDYDKSISNCNQQISCCEYMNYKKKVNLPLEDEHNLNTIDSIKNHDINREVEIKNELEDKLDENQNENNLTQNHPNHNNQHLFNKKVNSNHEFGLHKSENDSKILMNALLKRTIYQYQLSRSQPPSLTQSPRPPSTNSTPYR